MQARSSSAIGTWAKFCAAAVVLGLAIWWIVGSAGSPAGEDPDAPDVRGAALGEPGDRDDAGHRAERTRLIEVLVEQCRGPASDALVFAKVEDELISARTDGSGKARLWTRPGAAEVSAKVAGVEGRVRVGAEENTIVVKACRGAEVHGKAIYSESGMGAPGYTVSLVDPAGQVLDEIDTDEEGHYRLYDEDLVGAAILISDPETSDEPPVTTTITPLRSGEVREVNLVVGPTLELVGWVVDVRGEPLSGVLVSAFIETWDVTLRAVTDQGGGFVFERAPLLPMRVTADGGDLGTSSLRVVPDSTARKDVTLVLEPTGGLIVLAPPEVKGQVVISTFSQAAHGPQGMWNDPIVAPEIAVGEEWSPEVAVIDSESPVAEETPPEVDAMRAQFDTALREPLLAYDPERPVDGMIAMIEAMVTAQPLTGEMLRQEMLNAFPDAKDKPLRELARLAAEKALAEEPEIAEMLATTAEKVQGGMGPTEAIMAAVQEVEAERRAEAPPNTAEALTAEPEHMSVEEPLIEGEPDMTNFEPSPEAIDTAEFPVEELEGVVLKRLREEVGPLVTSSYIEESSVVARGKIGDELRVRGAFRYQVVIVLDEQETSGERYQIHCGEVVLPAGRTVEMYCGRELETTVTGTVVDVQGKPLQGAKVMVFGADETTTDGAGRYSASWMSSAASPCTVRVEMPGAEGEWRPSERYNLPCVQGQTLEVEPIVVRRESEAPVLFPDAPFGGIGGALIDGSEGVIISDIRPDAPLALDGIEPMTQIVKVDDEDALSWPVEEMIARLRGDVGTHVMLQLRSADGELIETVLERSLVTP